LGQKLGFPTANIDPERYKLIPANGVYAIKLHHGAQVFNGVMNIGVRPTIEPKAQIPVLEAHLFDFKGNLYGEFVTLQFIAKLRNEQRFGSIDELKTQIEADKLRAVELFLDTLPG
jgi:riboflavin kinase / FMN adenylyltransferase